jgi:hypothetical protein
MAISRRAAGIGLAAAIVVAALVYVFVTPYNRTPGVRLGGTPTAAPADWTSVNSVRLMQLKPDGFPPFVVNIWFVGTPEGVITATRPDGGYWGQRVRANPNATVRIGGSAYKVKAREVRDYPQRKAMLAAYVDKYNLQKVAGMTLDDLANPSLPWEVFFWTPQ